MNLKAQSSIEIILVLSIIIIFSAVIVSLIVNSSNSTLAIATLKTETLNALSNESFEFFIQRIDFYYDSGKPTFNVLIKSPGILATQIQEACSKLDNARTIINNKFYSNAVINFKINESGCL